MNYYSYLKRPKQQAEEKAVQSRLEQLKKFVSCWTEVNGLSIHARVDLEQALADALLLVLVHGLGLSSTYLVPDGG